MANSPRTIGQVLEMIREEFPDISVSKLRYLESEGLIAPDRDHPSGYRRFSQSDVDRLLFVLRAQRDRYLPLKVIRDQLEAMDRGEPLPEPEEAPAAAPVTTQPAKPQPTSRLVTRRQLLQQSELSESSLIELERAKIVAVQPGTNLYGPEAVTIAVATKTLSGYGIDVRQLKVIHQGAMAEAALVEQALAPYQRRSGFSRAAMAEVYKSVLQAHAAMLHTQIR